MAKITFIGLGMMGSPMASRLLGAGYHVTVWNRTMEKTRPLVDRGARPATSPAEAVSGAEVAITMLADPKALDQVLFGPNGVVEALVPGQILIEMSTVGPDAIRSTRERLPHGVSMVDAPVRGSVPEATEGRLQVLVGADTDAYALVEPILKVFGTTTRVGGPGSGAAMKLVVNSTLGAAISGAGEAIALGDALGLDRDAMLDVLSETPLGAVIRSKREDVESGSYPPRFKLSLARKDLQLVADAAAASGLDLKVAAASREWLEEAAEAGLGDLDYSAVIAQIIGSVHARGDDPPPASPRRIRPSRIVGPRSRWLPRSAAGRGLTPGPKSHPSAVFAPNRPW
jgi:3-hydroxyisobutyrate dehydrogenase-like beta-hydroxyacid dehydrogenase